MAVDREDEIRDCAAWTALVIGKTGAINADCANALRHNDAQSAKVYLKSAIEGAVEVQKLLTHALVHAERGERGEE